MALNKGQQKIQNSINATSAFAKNLKNDQKIQAQAVNQKLSTPSIPQGGANPYKPQQTYQAKEVAQNLPEFELQRRLAEQRLRANEGEQQSALDRKFAMLGGGPSGASIKASQNLGESLLRQREETLGGLGLAEAQERQRRAEIESGRAFESGEAGIGREFAAGEALRGREFAAGESALDRQLQKLGLDQNQAQFLKQYMLQNKQFRSEREDQEFNKAISRAQMKESERQRLNDYLNNQGNPDAAERKIRDRNIEAARRSNTSTGKRVGLY